MVSPHLELTFLLQFNAALSLRIKPLPDSLISQNPSIRPVRGFFCLLKELLEFHQRFSLLTHYRLP